MYKHAVLIGNFEPLNKGHIKLINQALQHSQAVTILLSKYSEEKISANKRKQWILQTFPERLTVNLINYRILKCADERPTMIKELSEIIRTQVCPPPDVIFSSSKYSKLLAEELKIAYEEVDINRKLVSLSSEQIIAKPLSHWDVISNAAKPYFVKKIALVGPQSVGKSTLSVRLANHFHTEFVEEYGRIYTNKKPELQLFDYIEIAKGKLSLQQEKIKTSNKVIICDTDIISTKVYLDIEFSEEAHILKEFFQKCINAHISSYEMYFLVTPRGEGVEDGSRKHTQIRKAHFEMLKENLTKYGVPFVVLDGDYQQNYQKSVKLIQQIIEKY